MNKKKMYEVCVNVKTYAILTVQATSIEEAEKRFNQYLREEGLYGDELLIDGYEPVSQSDITIEFVHNPDGINIDEYFEEEEEK